ncbi:unnamed protein product [Absidia cylindrospora]
MSDDYDNVEWNVHATSDAVTPRFDTPDPLSAYAAATASYDNQPTSPLFSERTNSADNHRPQSLTLPSLPFNSRNTESIDTSTTMHSSSPYYVGASSSSVDQSTGHRNDSRNIRTTKTAKPMIIQIGDAQKLSDGTQGAYVSYLVTTTTSVEIFSATNPRPVRRRFHDFVWLYNSLCSEYPACIVPPLPEKHRLEYIKGDRFSSDFIERRKLCLQWFLDRIARHPILQQSQCTRVFLESLDFKNDKRAQAKYVPPSTTVLESLSDTLLNAFTKIKKQEERFIVMKDHIDKLEDNLNIVERLYTRIGKRQYDMQQDYISFGDSIQGLSTLESNINQPLHQFAETAKSYGKALKTMSNQEDILYLNRIHELLSYCRSAKTVFRDRDQKQMDFEALSAYLQQTIQDKERIKYPGRHDNGTVWNHIPELVMDKIKQARGMDMEHARREKMVRLEIKIKDLQDEVALANDTSQSFSEQVIYEFDLFQQYKTNELKHGLAAYVDTHVDFYQKGISIWEKILPALEAIEVNDLKSGDNRDKTNGDTSVRRSSSSSSDGGSL